jgi:cation transport ATPase
MEFSLRHFIRGRIRLHVPTLCRKRKLAEQVLAWLGAQKGIKQARVNYACATLVIEYDLAYEGVLRATIGRLSLIGLDELQRLVAPDTAPAGEFRPAAMAAPAGSRPAWSRVPLALPSASLLMAFSLNPIVTAVNFPLMLWNAYPIALRAWRVWRREGRPNVDFLDTLAIAASLAQGNPMAGAIITWLIKLGDWIRDLTAAGSRRAISELLEFQTRSAWVLRNGVVTATPASQLAVGDEVVVYPGEIIPVDGEIIDGHAMIDQKTITGEGLPITRAKGEAVFAATVIRDGQLTVRAIRVGTATTAG